MTKMWIAKCKPTNQPNVDNERVLSLHHEFSVVMWDKTLYSAPRTVPVLVWPSQSAHTFTSHHHDSLPFTTIRLHVGFHIVLLGKTFSTERAKILWWFVDFFMPLDVLRCLETLSTNRTRVWGEVRMNNFLMTIPFSWTTEAPSTNFTYVGLLSCGVITSNGLCNMPDMKSLNKYMV